MFYYPADEFRMSVKKLITLPCPALLRIVILPLIYACGIDIVHSSARRFSSRGL
jgi:hypothetical protein